MNRKEIKKMEVIRNLHLATDQGDTDLWDAYYLEGTSTGIISREDVINIFPLHIAKYEEMVRLSRDLLREAEMESYASLSKKEKEFLMNHFDSLEIKKEEE